jgi:hypothetical protein
VDATWPKGTTDNNGNINGLASFIENQTSVTVIFAGAPTANGIVLNGTWDILSTNVGGGVTISGSGTWTTA